MKPFAESCVQNQAEICAVLESLFTNSKQVLEIASGTGQHAVYFAERMPHLIWQTSDLSENHKGIQLWLDEAKLANVRSPIQLDVSARAWPEIEIDAVFSANAVHIMPWQSVISYFKQASNLLNKSGLFILYGPFNYEGKFTSKSNERFHHWLKARNPESGVRDFETLDSLANQNQMSLLNDFEMAANNRILCWKKSL